MEIELHLVNTGHHEISVGLPGQLHVRRIKRLPHEEADILPVR